MPEGSLTGPEPLLRARRLGRSFGGRQVITGLDLDVAPGQRAALVGPNGSGKSTFIRCVAGTLAPTRGTVSVGPHPSGSLGARRVTGSSFAQERAFYLRLSGFQNLLFFARLREPRKRHALAQVRDLVGELRLEDVVRKRVDRCSAGMVQQLAFARALLGDPALLLLDEPTRSLDEAAAERLWAALDRRPRLALVVASHHREDLARCDVTVDFPA